MRSVHLLRSLHRVVQAGLLAVLISGLPAMAAQLAGCDDCAGECDGSFGTKSCPPNCTKGACARVFPTVVALTVMPSPPSFDWAPTVTPPAQPHASERNDGIFHPPRA